MPTVPPPTLQPAEPSPTTLPPHAATVTQLDSECTLDLASEPITEGRVEFTAINETDSVLAFDIWRIADGSTYEQLAAHIEKENGLAEASQEGLGPPSLVGNLVRIELGPHDSRSQAGKVISGSYAILCIRDFNDQAGKRPFSIVGPFQVE
jgi:hypothetical protein